MEQLERTLRATEELAEKVEALEKARQEHETRWRIVLALAGAVGVVWALVVNLDKLRGLLR